MDTTKFKTEEEKKHAESVRKIVLQHCVACHQQLDLLQLRLINFEDLVNGVQDTIQLTNKQLSELNFEKAGVSIQPTKLKKV
ncbi:hypothetical protein [Microviridae sp.]|jgi:mono/diheme cytochrome c family protein|nr:hypothetical protein [Microviridae sp.]